MTDAAYGFAGVVVIQLCTVWIALRNGRKSDANAQQIGEVKKQGDGLTRDFAKLTGEAEHAKGVIEGKAKEKAATQRIKAPKPHKK